MTYPSPWSHSAGRACFQTLAVYLACNQTKHYWHKKLEDDCLVAYNTLSETFIWLLSALAHMQIGMNMYISYLHGYSVCIHWFRYANTCRHILSKHSCPVSFMIKKKKNAIIPECVLKCLCVEQILLSQLVIGIVSSSEHLVSFWKSTFRKTFKDHIKE